jgi:hypothetical protein
MTSRLALRSMGSGCLRRRAPGAFNTAGREALLRYVLRPPVAQERIEPQKDGLIAITLKRAYADGTVAVVMDSLSLLCRLAMSVPHLVTTPSNARASSPVRAPGVLASRPLLPLLSSPRNTMMVNSRCRGAQARTLSSGASTAGHLSRSPPRNGIVWI